MQKSLEGSNVLGEVAAHLGIDLCSLVAGCAYWAPKESDCIKPVYLNVRRARTNKGEERRTTMDRITFDDNTKANFALKNTLKHVAKFKGFEVCHIWPDSCYDERYHTTLANLVLLPRAIASLTDHDQLIQQCLQYRSWELYKWHPENKAQPKKPNKYPTNWLDPIPPHQKREKQSRGSKLVLPITLVPPKENEFKNAFMLKGQATIYISYSDRPIEETVWQRKNFTKHSSVLRNLRSRPRLRSGEWQRNRITKVEVKVLGY